MLFQEFAIQHNINWKQIEPSAHAILRSKERFGWTKQNDDQIKGNLRALIKNSTYVGEVIDEQGKLSHMFASERRGIYLSDDMKRIRTVMDHQHVTYTPLKNVLANLHKKEIRKLDRKENARIRQLENFNLDCNVDLAILNRRISRTRSQSVKLACTDRINAIKQTVAEYEKEIKSIQDEKRQISRSLVAIV